MSVFNRVADHGVSAVGGPEGDADDDWETDPDAINTDNLENALGTTNGDFKKEAPNMKTFVKMQRRASEKRVNAVRDNQRAILLKGANASDLVNPDEQAAVTAEEVASDEEEETIFKPKRRRSSESSSSSKKGKSKSNVASLMEKFNK